MAYNQGYAYPAYNAQYAYPPGQSAQYAQQQQQQQQAYPTTTTPQIRNPFAPPPPPPAAYTGANAAFDPEYEQQVALWNSAYAQPPGAGGKKGGKDDPANGGAAGTASAAGDSTDARPKVAPDGSKLTVVRKGGGESWEDKSLLEWDPNQFRIMVGNLAGEVTDDSLAKAFATYGVAKARVIRDKLTTKSKGYGFVSFTDAEMGFKAAREMSNKYIGSHPITIKRSRTDVKPVVKKDPRNYKGKNRNNNNNNKDKNKEGKKNGADPLKANTGAGVEKKLPAKTPGGLKLLG
jgi:hypothetical protein